MPTALPPSTDFTAASNQAGVKGFVTSLRAFLSGLLGTTGSTAAARIALELEATRADIASAATLDLDSTTTHSLRVTGTTATTAMTLADGAYRKLVAAAAWPITNGANLVVQGNADYTCVAGDIVHAFGEPAGVVRLAITRLNGTAVVAGGSGAFALSADISPAQITADQNDYNPAGLAAASALRLNSDAARNVTGLAGGSDGRILVVHNVGSFPITLKDEAAGSTAAYRFALTADLVLAADAMALLQYDSTSSRWRAVSASGSSGGITLGTPVNSTSGTSIDFTGIPAGTKRITINFNGVSTNGTSNLICQLGDSGGVETTGYLGVSTTNHTSGAGAGSSFTDGFGLAPAPLVADVWHGSLVLNLVNAANNTWAAHSLLATTAGSSYNLFGAGTKSTSATLDRVRITTSGGTAAFDLGEINISYE